MRSATLRVHHNHARSWLLVPGTAKDLLQRLCKADVVVIDLEDGVVPRQRAWARAAVRKAAEQSVLPWVRLSAAGTADWEKDIELLRSTRVGGVVLAKTEGPQHVRRTLDVLGPIPLVALIESALGVERAIDIAESGPARLAFGSGDYRRDTGVADSPAALAYPRSRLVIASRIAGIPGPIDGPSATLDSAVTHEATRDALTQGMRGRICLHDYQVPIVESLFTPPEEDLEWANTVLDEFAEHGIRDGSDLPRIARARHLQTLASIYRVGLGKAKT